MTDLMNLREDRKFFSDRQLEPSKLKRQQDMMPLVFSGAGIAFLTQVVGYGLAYSSNIFYARWMGLTEYGIFSYISAWALLLATFAGLEFPMVLLRFIPEYEAKKNWALLRGLLHQGRLLVFAAGGLMAILCVILAFFIESYKSTPYAEPLLAGAWMIPLWALIYLHTAMSRAFKSVAVAYGPPRVLKPAMLLGFAFLYISTDRQLTGTALLAGSVIVLILVLLLQWGSLTRLLPYQIKRIKPELRTRQWLRVSLSVLAVAAFFIVLQQTSTLIIGIWLDPEQVGLYSAAAKTTQLMNMPSLAMAALSVPLFSSLHARGDLHGLQEMLSKTVSWAFWPSVMGAVILIAASRFFLGLFGPEFTAAQPAAIILILGGLVTAGGGPVLSLMQVTGRQRQAAFVIGSSALAGIVLNIAGIYFFGITGGAGASVITTVLWIIRLNLLSIKTIGVHPSICYALAKKRSTHEPLS